MPTRTDRTIDHLTITPLARIATTGGDVQHYIRADSDSYEGFGEVYFSHIHKGVIKAWKRHRQMTLNLVVPIGDVRFVFWDEERKMFSDESIGDNRYARLTVAPGVWFGFQGIGEGANLVANFADIIHDPNEVDRRDLAAIDFDWRIG
jgi:dTDP-4-dehydrorhamnose 3,5-epimerase